MLVSEESIQLDKELDRAIEEAGSSYREYRPDSPYGTTPAHKAAEKRELKKDQTKQMGFTSAKHRRQYKTGYRQYKSQKTEESIQLDKELDEMIEQEFFKNPHLDPDPPTDKSLSAADSNKFRRRDKAYWSQYGSQKKHPESTKEKRGKTQKQRASHTRSKRVSRIDKELNEDFMSSVAISPETALTAGLVGVTAAAIANRVAYCKVKYKDEKKQAKRCIYLWAKKEKAKKKDKELDEAIQLKKLNELFGKEPYMGYKSNVAHQKKTLRLKRNLIKGMGLGGKVQYKDMMKRAKQGGLTPEDYRTIKTLR